MEPNEDSTETVTQYAWGIFSIAWHVMLMVGSNYGVKDWNLAACDVCFSRGILQSLVFAAILLRAANDFGFIFLPRGGKEKMWTLTYGIINGVRFLIQYSAITMIPMEIFTIICSLMPVFTLVLAKLMLSSKQSVLKVVLCVTVVAGICLVVDTEQFFNFGSGEIQLNETTFNCTSSQRLFNLSSEQRQNVNKTENINNTCSSLLKIGSEEEQLINGTESSRGSNFSTQKYVMGIILAVLYCLLGAWTNVIPSMYPKISSNSLMFWSGCGSVLVSFVGPLMGMQMKVVNNIHSIDVRYWGLLVAVSIAGIAYNFAIILGNKMIPPHLASMFCRFDVLVVLGADAIVYHIFPHTHTIIGSLVIMGAVISIALADKIETCIENTCTCCFRKPDTCENNDIELVAVRDVI